ncbi:uncharacterized protein LOC119566352 isoform X2 [Chelonia mydas]|uniref:uncharacterized protein LOC119566352 isoform X2 n=1 Tax=Chelonia mydas TaxID=8469 RepID=UPI001CA9AA53|nr:uncharacterized protein LOC119566352 isoform X2 [Chelonia mydas]
MGQRVYVHYSSDSQQGACVALGILRGLPGVPPLTQIFTLFSNRLHKKHERSQDKLKFHTDNDLFTLLYTLHAEIHTNAMDHGQEPQGPPGDSSQAPFRTAQGIGTNATMKTGSGNRQESNIHFQLGEPPSFCKMPVAESLSIYLGGKCILPGSVLNLVPH